MKALPSLLILVLLALAPTIALSEDPPSDEEPEPDPHRVYSMGTVTVREEAPPTQVVDVESVSAEEIEARNARTVAEALEALPGIRVSTGRKSEPNVSIHGLDQSKILVMIDGVPYYETYYGRLDLNQIPTSNIARIEIHKGAASVLYGANALGGVINIITKEASEDPFTGGRIEVGENSLGVLSLSRGARVGRFSYWFNYTRQERDGWDVSGDYEPVEGQIVYRGPNSTVPAFLQERGERTNSDVERDAAWLKLGYERGPNAQYWVNLHYLNMTKGLAPATDQARVILFRPAFSQLGRMPDYRDTGIDLDVREKLGDRLFFKGKLFYHDHEDNYDSYFDLDYDELLARSTFKDSILGATAILESPLNETNTLRFALNYKKDTHEERADDYLPYAETGSYTGSVALEDEIRVGDDLRLLLGLSFDWFEVSDAEASLLDRDGNFLGKESLETPREEFWNPSVGLNWSLGARGELFASIGRKSRFPLLSQLYSSRSGNSELEPEKSTNFVVGYERRLGKALTVEASGFWYEISDLISRNGTDPLNIYENFAEVRIRGIELATFVRPREGLLLRFDVTWIDAEDRSGERVTEEVLNVPEFSGTVAVRWDTPGIPAHVDITGTYMDEVFTALPSPRFPDDPAQSVDSVFLTRIRLGYDILPGLEAWAAARNVFDEDYESEFGFPGPGRAFSGGLSARF